MKKTLLALLTLLPLAAAQEIQPINPSPTTPSTPGTVEPLTPVSSQPVNVPMPSAQPSTLSGVNATLSAPLALKGKATLVLTLKSTLKNDLALAANRDNRQNCAFAPSIRVLKFGTREVVYPDGSGNAMLCAQDMKTDTLKAGGSLRYTRTLELSAGEYMIEGWYQGLAGDNRVKIGAQPVKVTVK
ncbi:hypothetical protein D3875_08505 [Deinococcus cavernae]|uniref:Intracellular proteinase inhibitor BsuPI domain-containing protein n=1 Tax=Deinococcus cavernae TaxID=2320857 RepID=A0A418V6A8_9DEIO|nr:hypothetical protein [Deinococcus cavernae]RJF71609.1 hypothetical protein D3875_08505 [Deinococcus cavernae]